MRVAFLGAEPNVGTTANMALAAWGSFHHPLCRDGTGNVPMQFAECKKNDLAETQEKSLVCDLLAVNLSLNSSGLEELFLNKSFVQRNIIFLIGKYYHSQERELERFSRWYRIPRERICPIPFNQRFRQAYESGRIPSYLRWQEQDGSFESMQFGQCLRGMLLAMEKFGKRKGEIYYG